MLQPQDFFVHRILKTDFCLPLQGILGLLSAVWGEEFFEQCYNPIGEIMDIMALINSSVNFILYCFMSKQFRKTFVETFHLQRCAASFSICGRRARDCVCCCCPCCCLARLLRRLNASEDAGEENDLALKKSPRQQQQHQNGRNNMAVVKEEEEEEEEEELGEKTAMLKNAEEGGGTKDSNNSSSVVVQVKDTGV